MYTRDFLCVYLHVCVCLCVLLNGPEQKQRLCLWAEGREDQRCTLCRATDNQPFRVTGLCLRKTCWHLGVCDGRGAVSGQWRTNNHVHADVLSTSTAGTVEVMMEKTRAVRDE